MGLRNLRRAVREEADVCRAGLIMSELPIQRLILILPPEEQPAEVLEGLKSFPKMPAAGVRLPGAPRQEQQPGRGDLQLGEVAPPRVQVQLPDQPEVIVDAPRPQRARGRPRRAQ